MDEDRLKIQIQALVRWRNDVVCAIQDYHSWLQQTGLETPEVEVRLFDSIETVKSDRLTIAFVAEFSRGKTELINAIFFADYKRRLLPSTVGRTTMCPTELFYDSEENGAYIRLLPIETRKQDTSISDLKRDQNSWKTLALNTESPDQMAEALQEVVRAKTVSIDEAKSLGLYSDDNSDLATQSSQDTPAEIEIPVWRHALISFPHPLLKQGLVILDTPGLNALGTEPELTLNMLPAAQAVVFVLAPDTGVTKSDLDIWQYYIKNALDTESQKGVIATLNKIDTLWDEMKDEHEIEEAIQKQCRQTAEMLNIDSTNVLPVSAQKALVAKAKQDPVLLEKSRILALESLLADDIIPAKRCIVSNRIAHEVGSMINNSRNILSARLEKLRHQSQTFHGVTGRNTDVIKHLTQKTREQQIAYNNNMKYMQSSRRTIAKHSAAIMNELSLEAFDYHVTKTRKDMTESWTTGGLKKGMKVFFEGISDTMQVVARQTSEAHEVVESVYNKFHQDHGLPEMEFPQFSVEGYLKQLAALSRKAEAFRNSTVTTMTEQSFVVKKFFISLVSHTREVFFKAHHEAEVWFKEIMNPLIAQIHMHKQLLEQHLDTLCKINDTKETLAKNIELLEKQCASLELQLSQLDTLETNLHRQLGDIDDTEMALTPNAEFEEEAAEAVPAG